MNVLEKILKEIREIEKKYVVGHNVLFALGATGMATEISGIIRSHMDDVPKCGECSRKKLYQIGYEDGKKDKDWISVEDRLPNQNGVYNVTRLVDDAFISDSAYFDGQDTWHNDNRVNHIRPYLTDIVAWQPLPELYKAMEG